MVKRRKKSKLVVQMHHITYEPEWAVPVYKGEHWAITNLDRRSNWSVGMVLHLLERISARLMMGQIIDLGPHVHQPGYVHVTKRKLSKPNNN
jgi:hypothetical protein